MGPGLVIRDSDSDFRLSSDQVIDGHVRDVLDPNMIHVERSARTYEWAAEGFGLSGKLADRSL